MITIIARWDYWDRLPTTEQGTYAEFTIWEQICLCYNVKKLIMVPRLMNSTLEQYDTFEEALEHSQGKRVFLEKEQRAKVISRVPVFLENYIHPEDVTYVFGNTELDNSSWVREEDTLLSVRIPHNGDMYGVSIAPIVLNDRMEKS